MRVYLGWMMLAWLFLVTSSRAETLQFSGGVQTGEVYRHSIGRGLVLEVTTDEMRVRRAGSVGDDDNFVGCVNTPLIGPKGFEFQAMDFDPARGKEALGVRRFFHFVLTAADEEAECVELRRVIDPDAKDNNWYSHPMGRATVTLSQVKLSGSPLNPDTVVQSFRLSAVVRLPRTKHRR